MRRRLLFSSNNIEIKPIGGATYADVCFVDNETLEKVIVSGENINEDFPTEDYTPIGVVVVPSSHTDNNRPRIMSLAIMSCEDPENGAFIENISDLLTLSMTWGESREYIPNLDEKEWLPYISNYASGVTTNGGITFSTRSYDEFYLPMDNSNYEYENPSNSNEYFSVSGGDGINLMCSPYKEDGSKDYRYFREPPIESGGYSALADFDGMSNTEKILAQRGSKDYSTWKPTYNNGADYPAASCCDMFHTIGTEQGDWYLPSAGELGYFIVRLNAISLSLIKLANLGFFNQNHITYYFSNSFTSTQQSSTTIIGMRVNGNMEFINKGSLVVVHAFLEL